MSEAYARVYDVCKTEIKARSEQKIQSIVDIINNNKSKKWIRLNSRYTKSVESSVYITYLDDGKNIKIEQILTSFPIPIKDVDISIYPWPVPSVQYEQDLFRPTELSRFTREKFGRTDKLVRELSHNLVGYDLRHITSR